MPAIHRLVISELVHGAPKKYDQRQGCRYRTHYQATSTEVDNSLLIGIHFSATLGTVLIVLGDEFAALLTDHLVFVVSHDRLFRLLELPPGLSEDVHCRGDAGDAKKRWGEVGRDHKRFASRP